MFNHALWKAVLNHWEMEFSCLSCNPFFISYTEPSEMYLISGQIKAHLDADSSVDMNAYPVI